MSSYKTYITAKVKAKRYHDGVASVHLDRRAYELLRGDDRWVRPTTPETAPVRFGMAGDFEVQETNQHTSYLMAKDGTRLEF